MAYENLCLYCFKDSNGDPICPHCGKDARAAVPQIQMLPGSTVYHDRFLVGRALGQDSGGIVYTAMDTKRGGTIRIREYLPRNCAERLNDGTVVPIAGMEDAFETGMRKLRASVDSVDDPKKRHFYFEENGTAYIAQRKNTGGAAPAPEYEDDEDDAADHRRQIAIYIAVGAAIVLIVAIGLIWFLNSMSDSSDVTLPNTLSTTSPDATWMPDATPTPTPYATATFAALVDPELSWMDYTYSGNVSDDYQQQQSAVATKKPELENAQDYDTVNGSSSSNTVKALQQKLANLGWLSSANISGKYDSATKQAVKDFQNYVNNYCNSAQKLAVDGIAGEKTQQWLYNSSVSLLKPTPTPTPLVTAKTGDTAVVDASSSKSEIKNVQNKLIALGLLPDGSADGKFGSTTATAVKNFQIRVNQILKYEALEVNGVVNADTMAYLNYYVEWWEQEHKATATPKPEITATPKPDQTRNPDGSVNQNSTKAEITAMQKQLQQVGLLSASGVDGVYGSGTVAAVKNFQSWVNQLRGEETLQVTGVCDSLTRAYLDYCIENNRKVELPTEKPETTAAPTAEMTPVPTDVPTTVPTDAPYEPDEGQGEGDGGATVVNPSSPAESISYVQEMLSEIGLMDASGVDGNYGEITKEAVRKLQQFVNEKQGEQVLEVTGICDAETLQYLMYCYDHGWNLSDTGDEPDPTDAPTQEPAQSGDGGVYPSSSNAEISGMQEMLSSVGLMDTADVDGSYGEGTASAVRALQEFVNAQKGEHVLDVTGECDALTLQYLKYCYEQGWNLADTGDEPDPTDVPAQEPTAEPTQAPTNAPAVGSVNSFSLSVSGAEAESGALVELESGAFTVQWGAEGDIAGYYIYLYDGSGTLINSAEGVKQTSLELKTSGMNPGEAYELRVGALPENGTQEDIVWKTVRLMLPVQATAEPTQTPDPTEAPTQAPSVSAPTISIGSSVYQQDGVTYVNDSTIIFSWMASGDVQSYTVYLLYEDGSNYPLGETTDTSKTVRMDQLQAGLYKLYVGATPVGGDGDDTIWSELLFGVPAPEATAEPQPESTDEPTGNGGERIEYIDASSSASDIQTVQMALYKYGLLNADSIEPGVLDAGTLEAVAAFQQKVNESYGASLDVIDPASGGGIDGQTLDYLLYQSLDF